MKPVILLSTDYAKVDKRELHCCDSRYVNAVHEAGAIPLLCPSLNDEAAVNDILKSVHGALFIGGADYPPSLYNEGKHPFTNLLSSLRSASDVLLCRSALRLNLPILGICAGCQLLNIVSGGKLVQHINDIDHHPETGTHNVILSDYGILHEIYDGSTSIEVNTFHHQAIDSEHLGQGFRVTAKAPDGTVEAIELDDPEKFVLGVQWHPERFESFSDRNKLFSAFISAASKYSEKNI